jgi:hypothetical protein
MATQARRTAKHQSIYGPGGSSETDRNDQTEFIQLPAKVKGGFKTFEDGSKFRLATNYSRSRAWNEAGNGQNTNATGLSSTYKGRKMWVRESSGGYISGLVFNTSFVAGFDETGGLKNVTLVPTIPTDMRNEVITKALLDFADQKVNLGENLATLQQTLRLLTDPSNSLAHLIKELYYVGKNKKFWPYLNMCLRDIRRGPGLSSAAAQEYLKYVYGWKPLMQDTYGLIELSKNKASKPLLLHASRKTSTSLVSNANEYNSISDNTKVAVDGYHVDTTVRASLHARIDPDYQGARALNQLGLLNPASLFWELVPWSFVVDWVVPIGPVLQALTAPAGLAFVDGSVASRVTAHGNYTTDKRTLTNGTYNVNVENDSPSSGLSRYEGYSRDHITGWPKPGLWFDSDPLRGDRVFKALALSILGLRSLRR